MAQTGFTPILLYSSSTAAAVPAVGNLTNSVVGSELAINITDGKLFYKDNANNIQVIGWKTTPTSAGGTGLTSYTAGDLMYYASGTTLTKLAIGTSTTILTSSGTAPQWTSASSVTVGTATNLAGGAGGSVPYQTAANTTTLLAIGSAYQALQVNAGGTAPSWQASATSTLTAQGDLLYASAANTLARLAKNTTATRYLANTGANNNPAWAQIDLSNGVTGTLPVGNGGTGITTLTAGYIPFGSGGSPFGSSASLFWDNSNVRLGIGTATPGAKITLLSTGSTTADGLRLVLGSEGRDHNIYSSISNGRDLTVASYRTLTINTGAGTTEGVLNLNAYEYTVFGVGSSYTERGRWTTTGLGIGKTAPQFALDVAAVCAARKFQLTEGSAASDKNGFIYSTRSSGTWVNGTSVTIDFKSEDLATVALRVSAVVYRTTPATDYREVIITFFANAGISTSTTTAITTVGNGANIGITASYISGTTYRITLTNNYGFDVFHGAIRVDAVGKAIEIL